MSDIGKYEYLIKDLLTRYRSLRDSVDELYLACIMEIRGKEYISKTSLYTFFHIDKKNKDLIKIPTMSSVIRLNTKIQKENPELRGIDWEKKQCHSKDYKKDLGYKI